MEVRQAKEEIKLLEDRILELLIDFRNRTEVRITNISVREDYFVAKEPELISVKIYTTIDSGELK